MGFNHKGHKACHKGHKGERIEVMSYSLLLLNDTLGLKIVL
mgnify:CR=1 FL=1